MAERIPTPLMDAAEMVEPWATLEVCRGMMQALVIKFPAFDESLAPVLARVRGVLESGIRRGETIE